MAYEGPALGTKGSEADIDKANQWMRSQPWYAEFLASIGQNPQRVKLNDQQKQQLGALMAQNGLPVPEKDEVDPAGNINPKGHKLSNFLKAAAIGGAALTGVGLAGIGPLAGLSSAVGTVGSAVPEIGLSSSAIGGMTAPGVVAASSGAGAGGGLLSTVGGLASKFLTGKAGDVLGAVGKGIGDATTAAGNNRMAVDELGMRGTANYETELNNRARTDADQRSQALKDVYRAGWYANRQASPNNTRGLPAISPNLTSTLSALEQQGMKRLENGSTYDMSTVAPLKPYASTPQSTLEKVGSWTGPIASTLGTIGRLIKLPKSGMPQ